VTAAGAFLEEARPRIDAALDALLPGPDEPPQRLHRAMRHPVFAGGKRLRPALLLAAVRCLDGDEEDALVPAAALELVHTYSLVHDDLPAMDDDDLRRGRPTTHVEFDEATAILAGDALLTLAFEALAARGAAPPAVRAALCAELAGAIGSRGMIGGQILDLEAQGSAVDPAALERIHRWKTGALIRASVTCGGVLAGASGAEAAALGRFGAAIGLAFQIVDDLLDAQAGTDVLGKTAGKDARDRKATFPGVLGLDESRRRAEAAVREAQDAIGLLGARGDLLRGLAAFVTARDR
jgi:geranylgeranyl pyrophosphate synthase